MARISVDLVLNKTAVIHTGINAAAMHGLCPYDFNTFEYVGIFDKDKVLHRVTDNYFLINTGIYDEDELVEIGGFKYSSCFRSVLDMAYVVIEDTALTNAIATLIADGKYNDFLEYVKRKKPPKYVLENITDKFYPDDEYWNWN